jgi:hypothetical protein
MIILTSAGGSLNCRAHLHMDGPSDLPTLSRSVPMLLTRSRLMTFDCWIDLQVEFSFSAFFIQEVRLPVLIEYGAYKIPGRLEI